MAIGTHEMSRRGFMGRAALVGAGTAAVSLQGARQAQADNAEDFAWDEECEVLVIGSGYAGLAAAYEAKMAGADVKVIEKLDAYGGNSMLADGCIAVCNSEPQKLAGVEDSVDLYVSDMQVAGLYLNDVEKCSLMAEKSNEAFVWASDVLGVEWQVDENGVPKPEPQGGHSVSRSFFPTGMGASIVMAELDVLEGMGVEVETGRMLTELIVNEDGRVVGATVHDGATDNDVTTGTPKNIKATKAVVMASGGYGNDVTWRMQHDPRLNEEFDSTNRSGATSEALQAAMRIGALAVHLDWIQLGPWCNPDEKGYGVGPSYIDAVAPYAPSIDPQSGLRIVNEMTDRKRYSDAIIENGVPLIQVVDARNIPDWAEQYLENCLEAGIAWQVDTLEEAAEMFDIPVDAFLEEMERYNSYVESGIDEEFGKTIPNSAKTIAEAPFYVTRVWPKIHHCMGGLKTDLDCRVLDASLKPIEGLYAAGECTGGIHGACRLGTCATTDCLVNGRIVGQQAAAQEAWA